jgi:nitrate reductase NapE component
MSQVEPKPKPDLTCWDCGAANDPAASECWLCQRRNWREPPRSSMPPKPDPEPTSGNATALFGLVLGLMMLGMAIAPGLVIGLLILVVPSWVGAEIIAHRRRNRGLPTSTTRKVVWIVVLAILLPILLSVALFIALWMICLVTGPPSFH